MCAHGRGLGLPACRLKACHSRWLSRWQSDQTLVRRGGCHCLGLTSAPMPSQAMRVSGGPNSTRCSGRAYRGGGCCASWRCDLWYTPALRHATSPNTAVHCTPHTESDRAIATLASCSASATAMAKSSSSWRLAAAAASAAAARSASSNDPNTASGLAVARVGANRDAPSVCLPPSLRAPKPPVCAHTQATPWDGGRQSGTCHGRR